MRLNLFFKYCLLFIGISAAAQNAADTDSLLTHFATLSITSPQQVIKGADFIYRTSLEDDFKARAAIALAQNYMITGDYSQAVKSLFMAKALPGTLQSHPEIKVQEILQSAALYQCLGLNELSQTCLNEAENLLTTENITGSTQLWAEMYRLKGNFETANNRHAQALRLYKKSLDYTAETINSKVTLAVIYDHMALAYLQLKDTADARLFIQKSVNAFPPYKTHVLHTIASLHNYEGYHRKAAAVLTGEMTGTAQGNITLSRDLYKDLANSYAALNDVEGYKQYYSKYIVLNDSIASGKKNARALLMTQLDQYKKDTVPNELALYRYIFYALIALTLLVMVFGYRYRQKMTRDHDYFKKIIYKINHKEVLQPVYSDAVTTVTAVPEYDLAAKTTITIPQKSTDIILEKLAVFEASQEYLDAQLSLVSLAKKLDTNTKYLSEIINTQKGKNFHAYVNELRVNYIVAQLQNNPVYLKYKVSYLAEKSGFTSHSTFATVFKSVTGISPTTFIKLMDKEKQDDAS